MNSRTRAQTAENSIRKQSNKDLKIRGFSQDGNRKQGCNRDAVSSLSSRKSKLSHRQIHKQNNEDPFEPFALFDFGYQQFKEGEASQDSDEKYKEYSPLTRISK